MIPEVVLAIIVVSYLGQVILFLYGLSRLRDRHSNTSKPFVSVVIAARNEEAALADCLQALTIQSYPEALYEVIIVNDSSTDRTQDICDQFHRQHSSFQSISAAVLPSYPGKTGALIQGIEQSKGEIILITDADCTVPPTWIESTVLRYAPTVGIVGGMTIQKAERPFGGMQSLDWAYLLGIASSSAALGTPLSTIGNNLSFRRIAYDSVGGYRALPFSITEDYSLFQAVINTGRWEYLYPLDPAVLVSSRPCARWIDLIRQKHRWAKGGLKMRPVGYLVMAVGFAYHASLAALLFTGSFLLASILLACKFIADYFFLHRILSSLQQRQELRWFIWFELYFLLYVVVLPFIVFLGGKVLWKERSY